MATISTGLKTLRLLCRPTCSRCHLPLTSRAIHTTPPALVKRPQTPFPFKKPSIDAFGRPDTSPPYRAPDASRSKKSRVAGSGEPGAGGRSTGRGGGSTFGLGPSGLAEDRGDVGRGRGSDIHGGDRSRDGFTGRSPEDGERVYDHSKSYEIESRRDGSFGRRPTHGGGSSRGGFGLSREAGDSRRSEGVKGDQDEAASPASFSRRREDRFAERRPPRNDGPESDRRASFGTRPTGRSESHAQSQYGTRSNTSDRPRHAPSRRSYARTAEIADTYPESETAGYNPHTRPERSVTTSTPSSHRRAYQAPAKSLMLESSSSWNPTKKLTYPAMNGLRHLHFSDPATFTRAVLAEKFGISYEAVSRILRSRFDASGVKAEQVMQAESGLAGAGASAAGSRAGSRGGITQRQTGRLGMKNGGIEGIEGGASESGEGGLRDWDGLTIKQQVKAYDPVPHIDRALARRHEWAEAERRRHEASAGQA